MKSKLLYAAATAAILTGLLPAAVSAAGSASFSLTPASGTYTQGSSFTVQVHENGDNVNVVTAKLTYDASKLTCNGVGDSSAFPSTVTATCGGGSVTISRYTTSTVSGDAVVGSINFTAIAGSGSTSVNFASGSQIASGGQNIWNGDTTGGTYNLTTPATTPGRGSDGSGSTANTGSVAGSSTQTTGNSANTTSTATPAATAQDSATTTATGTNGNDTAKKETAGADTTKNTADKHSSKAWIWLLIVLAAVAGASAYLVQHKRTEAIAAAAEAAKKAKASAPKKAAPKAKKSK